MEPAHVIVLEEGEVSGIVNKALTSSVAAQLGGALGTMLGEGAVAITARDNYPPSRMLKRAFSAGLMATGVTVVDLHAATLPELVFAIRRLGAKAGVYFSVALLSRGGVTIRVLDSHGIEFLRERVEELVERGKANRLIYSLPEATGWVTYAEYVQDIYTAAVVNYVDAHAIASKHFTVVCDVNFGPPSDVLSQLLSDVGAEGILLNSHKPPFRGRVTHMPSPSSVSAISNIVRASGAALGAALCTDATRVLLFDDEGRPLTCEEVLGVILAGLPQGVKVVASESLSSAIEEMAKRFGARLTRVRGYRSSLIRVARRTGSHLVVSGSHEVVFTSFSLSPDGMLTLLKVMETLAKTDEQASSLRDKIPRAQLVTKTVKLDSADYLRILSALKDRWQGFVTINGLVVEVDGVWVNVDAGVDHLRFSTEAVGDTEEVLDKVVEEVNHLIEREVIKRERSE